jgi:hypothetical protein
MTAEYPHHNVPLPHRSDLTRGSAAQIGADRQRQCRASSWLVSTHLKLALTRTFRCTEILDVSIV